MSASTSNITLEFTPAAKELLIDEGFDPTYGARPLKRTVQRLVLDPLALAMLQGEYRDGDTITVDARGGKLVFDAIRSPEPERGAEEGEVVEGEVVSAT